MYCIYCGEKMDEGALKCPSCGEETLQAKAQSAYHRTHKGGRYSIADHTGNFVHDDQERNKGMALMSYLPILYLVPILCAKDSPVARFHASQGLLLSVVNFIVLTLGFIFSSLGQIAYVGPVFRVIWQIALFIVFLARIYLIATVLRDKVKGLPFIGSAKLFG